MDRRSFIKSTAAVGTGLALAGCTGFGGTNDGTGGGDGTGTETASPQSQPQQNQRRTAEEKGELVELDGDIAQDSNENLEFLDVDLYRTLTPVEASGAGSSGQGGSSLGNESRGNQSGARGEGTATDKGEGDFAGNQTQTGNETGTGNETRTGNQTGTQSGDIFGPEGAGVGVKGSVKNIADEPFKYVEVNVTLYDETGDVLGTWLDNSEEESLDRLESGEVWHFDVVFENADIGEAARYTVSADGRLA